MSRLKLMLLLFALVGPLRLAGQNLPYQTFEIGIGRTGGFGGLNLNTSSTQIPENEAQVADNLWYLRDGGIAMRPGFSRINSTALGAGAPWLIDKIYYPSGSPSFVVGWNDHIWRLGNAGAFTDPDSILGYRTGTVRYVSGEDTLRGDGTSWVGSVQLGDTVKTGGNTWRILRVVDDSTLIISAAAGSTASGQSYHILYTFTATKLGGHTRVADFDIQGNEYHAGIVLRKGEAPALLGGTFAGVVDSLTGSSGTTWRVVDRDVGLTANEFAGYWLVVYGNRATVNHIKQLCYIKSNDAVSFTVDNDMGATQDIMTSGIQTGLRYLVFAPVGTVIDTGTVRRVTKTANDVTDICDLKRTSQDTLLYRSAMFEALTGKLVGQQFIVDYTTFITGTPDSVRLRIRSQTVVTGNLLEKGDKFILWQPGVAARHYLWYANQLVAGYRRFFPNELRWSAAGTIHNFEPNNYRVIGDRSDKSITAIKDFNGDLAAWQEADTWKMPGSNLSTGQLIHALFGIGCPAPRSLVISGNQATWMTLAQGAPKVVSWNGGGIGFNVVGQSSVFSGGGLTDLSAKIAPRLDRASIDSIGRAAAGLWQDHYILSYPIDGKDTAASSIAYHIPTGRWTTMDSGVALAASYFYNASASPDSGQLYFAHPNRGIIYQFGNSVSDTNAYTRSATWVSKDFLFGNYRELKQLMNFGLDYEKHGTLTGGSFTVRPYKNLPAVQLTEGVAPNNPLVYTLGTDSTGLHSESRWLNTSSFFRSSRFQLKINFAGSAGQQNNDLKINGFRFGVMNLGGL